MPLKLTPLQVGPWPMNMYILTCEASKTSAIVDPGAEPDTIMAAVGSTRVDKILLTHGHQDHVSALGEIKARTGAPVYLHPAEHAKFQVPFDVPLAGGDEIQVGDYTIQAIHTPGHTPGMISFDIGAGRMLVGDTLFGIFRRSVFPPFASDVREMIQSWKKLLDTGCEIFLPGHGRAISRERLEREYGRRAEEE